MGVYDHTTPLWFGRAPSFQMRIFPESRFAFGQWYASSNPFMTASSRAYSYFSAMMPRWNHIYVDTATSVCLHVQLYITCVCDLPDPPPNVYFSNQCWSPSFRFVSLIFIRNRNRKL